MGRKEHFWGVLADGLDLTGEPAPGISMVELWGSGRLLIEHHGGVLAYCPEEILISVSYGQLKVSGEDLTLSLMTRQRMIIQGKIQGLQIGDGCHESRE